ncbi:hypothetical protein Tco_0709952, partial [Tanacetum coccineum]
MVLRVEKKLSAIEHPISLTLPIDSTAQVLAQWNAVYDAYNEVSCLMLGTGVERFGLIQTFHACKQEERKSVSSYVLKMKGYVEKLERLSKGKGKGQGKDKSYIPKPKNPKPYAKKHPAKDDVCNHCCKRNCLAYLAELIKKKKQVGIASFLGLRGERKLKQGALYLCVGNGVRAQVEAIGSDDLVLPNGL